MNCEKKTINCTLKETVYICEMYLSKTEERREGGRQGRNERY